MNIKLAAIGSSPLIAQEIKAAVDGILNNQLPVHTFTTSEVTDSQSADIFICAQTQLANLQKVVPWEKIFVLDLTPTSRFFLDIARIPANETVCIFNNHFEYTRTVTRYCQSLGLDKLTFIPVAYDDMADDAVKKALQKAHYIIGVDRFVGPDVLLSPRYRDYLRENVQIIAGQRTASLPSSCALLHGIGQLMQNCLEPKYKELCQQTVQAAPTTSQRQLAAELAADADKAVSLLRAATLQSLFNQISADATSTDEDNSSAPAPSDEFTSQLSAIGDQIITLRLLNKKLLAVN